MAVIISYTGLGIIENIKLIHLQITFQVHINVYPNAIKSTKSSGFLVGWPRLQVKNTQKNYIIW